MKKFYSLMMLVLLTCSLSACGNRTPQADLDFETTDISVKKNNGITKAEYVVEGNVTVTNNSKYYVTNYPITYTYVDDQGDDVSNWLGATSVSMAPKSSITLPFYQEIRLGSHNGIGFSEKTVKQITNINFQPLTYELLPKFVKVYEASMPDLDSYFGNQPNEVDTWKKMTEESFNEAIGCLLTTVPKHVYGEPIQYYGYTTTPVAGTMTEKELKGYIKPLTVPFKNDTDNFIAASTIFARVVVKYEGKIIAQETVSNQYQFDAIAPHQEKNITFNLFSVFDIDGDLSSYAFEVTFQPFMIEGEV